MARRPVPVAQSLPPSMQRNRLLLSTGLQRRQLLIRLHPAIWMPFSKPL
jgi:hypothetical protein